MEKVKVFTKNRCGKCEFTKNWLKRNNVEYREVNIEKEDGALDEVIEMGFRSFPVVVIPNEEPYSGHDEEKLRKAL